jgi:26S proteasome regulatory subunit N6
MAVGDSDRVQEAQKLTKTNPGKAEAIYREITSTAPSAASDSATREYEVALISLGGLYRDQTLVSQSGDAPGAWIAD